jgi:2-polyprenyl-3-methyl-5-hydroxy-6-metoxy-1,4-benzoquinol methylase
MNIWKSCYQGSVRMGSFGRQSAGALDIWQCEGCGARHLVPMQGNVEEYYKSGEYRQDLSQGNTVDAYFKLTDDEQPHKLEFAGMHRLRGKVVADVGAGAGPFLDTLRGVAAKTIAIEPNENYHESLRQRGHKVYPFAKSAVKDLRGKLDAAVSFSVLEHVERPREFLEEIRALLKPGGFLALSTPNADDLMVEICPEYAAFFYRKVHLWYFTATALKTLAAKSGFSNCEVKFDHRFDLSNAMIWMRDKRPSGLSRLKFDSAVDAIWKQSLVTQGRSDYIYATLQ